jgi:hypothetical protein
MSPTVLGEYCARCGAKSTITIEPTPKGDKEVQVYRCPNGHGIQLIEDFVPPPTGTPTETGIVQWPVAEADTDIALTTAPTTVQVGSVFLIDAEYMDVTDISNIDNPGVSRAAHGTVAAAHAAGVEVSIWGTGALSASTAKSNAEPRDETKKEEAKRERDEERKEEEAEDRVRNKKR